MIVTCEKCGVMYDDAAQWTICNHAPLWAAADSYCREHDLVNCKLHHNRPPQNCIDEAIKLSLKSPCLSKRGAVCWAGSQEILGGGCNHKPGLFLCDQSPACKANCRQGAVHAEVAAVVNGYYTHLAHSILHVKTVDGALVPSGPPSCLPCAAFILDTATIKWVWLFHEDGWIRYSSEDFYRLSGGYHPAVIDSQESSSRETRNATTTKEF